MVDKDKLKKIKHEKEKRNIEQIKAAKQLEVDALKDQLDKLKEELKEEKQKVKDKDAELKKEKAKKSN